MSFGDYRGWVDKKNIWGVQEKEIIKINIFQRFEDLYWKSVNSLNRIQKRLLNVAWAIRFEPTSAGSKNLCDTKIAVLNDKIPRFIFLEF